MADKKTKVQVQLETVIDEKQVNQELDKVDKIINTRFKDGYVKLSADISNFKYPKQTVRKDGSTKGTDYSNLQKAQDALISQWNKLSKQGFSSHDDDLVEAMRLFKKYQSAVKSQYKGTDDTKDKQVMSIRREIGNALEKHFTRLAPATLGNGKKGSFMNITSDAEFERHARLAIKRNRAAQSAGIDLSKSELTNEDRSAILKKQSELEKQAKIDKVLEEKKYEKKHAGEIARKNRKELKKYEKQRAEQSKNAIPIPELDKPLEDVKLVASAVENLVEVQEDTRNKEQKAADAREDRKFIKGVERGASARRFNTPNNEVNLGTRSQTWDPTYLTKDFIQKMERGGTYVDSNALLRQTMQALPEEIKKSIDSLVTRIDRNEAMSAFNQFDDSERKQWSDIANQTGMSELLLSNVAKVQGALMRGEEGTTSEDFKNAIIVAVADAVEKGKSQIAAENYNKAIIGVGNMIMSRYDNMKDAIGGTNGGERGVGINYEEVKATLKEVFKGFQDTAETLLERAVKEFPEYYDNKGKSKKTDSQKTLSQFSKVFEAKLAELQGLVSKEVKATTNATEKQGRYDRAEYAAERVADSKEGSSNEQMKALTNQMMKDVEQDASTGMNTDANTKTVFDQFKIIQSFMSEMIGALGILASVFDGNVGKGGRGGGKRPPSSGDSIGQPGKGGPGSYQSILVKITQSLNNIDINVGNILQSIIRQTGYLPTNLPAIVEGQGVKSHEEPFVDKTKTEALNRKQRALESKLRLANFEAEQAAILEKKKEEEKLRQEERAAIKEKIAQIRSGEVPSAVGTSTIDTDTIPSIFDKIKKAFNIASGKTETEVDKLMSMNEQEQAALLAERRKTFGFSNTMRNAADTGDVAQISRAGQIWRRNKKDQPDTNPFRGLQITEGINVNYNAINDALQKAIERNQFKAQTGGGFFKQLLGSTTMYLGQDSIEKSRAEADGLNTVMAMMKDAILDLVNAIKVEESALKGMEASGTAVFNDDGTLSDKSSNEAFITAARMEELKMGLQGVLAEAEMTDDIAASVNGNMGEILKRLGFASPELQKCNKIIKNINIGLDKNGKALKFQKRTQEILNYSYQLMGRHIGQMFKNWMMMLNPLNGIKRLFSDFASYDVKWQRTMNVIKYNLRRIVKPMMEWIAQQLVNMIGLVNSLLKGIGSAFGQKWDLFDKDAANAEKMREELEAAANVTAGFDELHDIGGDSSNPAMDFSEDIYTPQWDGLNKILEDIGTTIGNIIKAVSDWTFWDWLILAGAALVGFTALKWLISLFSGTTNPLQTVAKGFSFLEKAVGWAILIWAFTEFTKALTAFVECMKTADWEDIVKTLLTLGGAFAELFLAAGGLLYLSTALGITAPAIAAIGAVVGGFALFVVALTDFIDCMKSADWEDIVKSLLMLAGAFAALVLTAGGLMVVATALGMLAPQMLGLAVVIAAFAPVISALASFVEAMKGLTSEDMLNGLLFLAGAFMAIAIAIGVLLVVLSAAIASGVGALAILALAGILAVVSLVIVALAELVRALGEAGEGIKAICEGIAEVIRAIGDTISGIITAVADGIATVIQAIADGIMTVLQPIMDFMDSVIEKVVELATTIVQEIGETIRTVIETVGEVVLGIVDAIVDAIPNLLKSIVDFCNDIGPAIENSIDAIIRSITKLVNFVVSAVEYICNLVIGAINKFSVQVPDWVPGIGGTRFGFDLQPITIPRFVPQYETGTNYVPNDGLAYLHKGEAVIPKKYNQPYQPASLSAEERAYMSQMMNTMRSLDSTMKQGITVNGQFTQRGSDLVAVVNRTKSQTGADLLSNVAYAR